MPDAQAVQTALAFDYGLGHIGCAAGQTLTGTGTPLVALQARDGQPDWEAVARLIGEWRPAILLVGLPLNMDGSESDLCVRARKFARRLHGRFGLPVAMVDERLSTREAKARAGRRDSYRTNPVDDIAAQVILETWLADTRCGLAP
ncbi:MAG TPA: Holliday junction resolvase RuvX [Porticoccaceae bacterium]